MTSTMLYIRVSEKAIKNIHEVLKGSPIKVNDKAALAIICEHLIDWASYEAAKGALAERLGAAAALKADPEHKSLKEQMKEARKAREELSRLEREGDYEG